MRRYRFFPRGVKAENLPAPRVRGHRLAGRRTTHGRQLHFPIITLFGHSARAWPNQPKASSSNDVRRATFTTTLTVVGEHTSSSTAAAAVGLSLSFRSSASRKNGQARSGGKSYFRELVLAGEKRLLMRRFSDKI